MAKRGRPFKRSQAEILAIKELKAKYYKLKNRIERISEKYGGSVLNQRTGRYGEMPAVDLFYEKGLDKFSVKDKSLSELKILRADIEYVSGLKTSYVKGAQNYQNYVAEWIDLYDKDKDAYDKIMTLYNRLVEENELTEKFKYAVIEEIYTMYETRGEISPAEAYAHIKDFFDSLYLNSRIEDLIGGQGYEVGGKVR